MMKLSRNELKGVLVIIVLVIILNSLDYLIPVTPKDFSKENEAFVSVMNQKFKEARVADSLELLKYNAPEKLLAEKKPKNKTSETKLERPISINKAGLDELQLLPRVGPTTAQRIIDYRNQHGGFDKLEDLKKVKGIGPKTFDKMVSLISL